MTFCKPDVLKPDVLNPDVLKPDVLKTDVLWVYPVNISRDTSFRDKTSWHHTGGGGGGSQDGYLVSKVWVVLRSSAFARNEIVKKFRCQMLDFRCNQVQGALLYADS